MSREHLYKAKRVNWREFPKEEWWVYGMPVKHGGFLWMYTGEINIIELERDIYAGQYSDAVKYEVDPETVCEYTGLNDKVSRKIFDGDICKDGDNIVRILWNDKYQWGVEILKTDSTLSKGLIFPLCQYDNCKENGYRTLEVISSIFDNTELLEGGETE